jgi:uncharacterized membrane protein YeaQ/YmgE (transglycosylase-associated protein family)
MHTATMMDLQQLAAVMAIAIMAGVMAEILLETGVHSRGLPVLAGLFGLYVGHWLFEVTGMPVGPVIAGYPILPAFVGAFGFCAFAKLASLGAAGPRW